MVSADLKDEYLDASSNARLFQTLRFAELTIFAALTAGLLNALFVRAAPLPAPAGAVIKVAGLFITLLFLILEERTMEYWSHFVNRAAKLEKDLGFKQYSTRPRAGVGSSRNAIRLFFVVMIILWTAALIFYP